VKKWASEQNIALAATPQAIVAEERVRSLFKQEIEKYGAAFKGFESVQDFALIADEFTTDNGMLTPSLKLKRRKVLEVHGPVIEALYTKRGSKEKPAAQGAAAS